MYFETAELHKVKLEADFGAISFEMGVLGRGKPEKFMWLTEVSILKPSKSTKAILRKVSRILRAHAADGLGVILEVEQMCANGTQKLKIAIAGTSVIIFF